MTIRGLLDSPAEGAAFQREINGFLDEFRAASNADRAEMIGDGPNASGRREGLLAAIVSALCREVGLEPPRWVAVTGSPEPYFAVPARGDLLRLRLMLESPPAFRVRNVFVPENYLSRA